MPAPQFHDGIEQPTNFLLQDSIVLQNVLISTSSCIFHNQDERSRSGVRYKALFHYKVNLIVVECLDPAGFTVKVDVKGFSGIQGRLHQIASLANALRPSESSTCLRISNKAELATIEQRSI